MAPDITNGPSSMSLLAVVLEIINTATNNMAINKKYLLSWIMPASGLVSIDKLKYIPSLSRFVKLGPMKPVPDSTEKPEDVNPELTRNFVDFITKKAAQGAYRVEVVVQDTVVPIDVFPTVFPPRSDYSASSKSVFETLNNLEGLEVADIGCGSGIESIVAALAGARHVDAADINPEAVDCTKHNVELNGLDATISVFYSDLFENFPNKKYSLIVANLPIINFDAGDTPTHHALYDKDFIIHKRFFKDARNFLTPEGEIVLTHANLQSGHTADPKYDFRVFEELVNNFGYEITQKSDRQELSYTWINYRIQLKK